MTHELYKRYRPKKLSSVLGQAKVVATLQSMIEKKTVPHALLFSGPSGTGKTTLARILKRELDCHSSDFQEINVADNRGIDTVREIRQRMGLAPIGGSCRIWLLDEVHSQVALAQQSLLKILEDTPKHVYFFLCTTDPGKLLKTIHSRCTEFKLQSLTSKDMMELLVSVLKREEVVMRKDVADRIIEVADGSPRKALVILGQVLHLETEEDRLDAVEKTDSRRLTIELCRALLNHPCKWADVKKILDGLNDDDPESIRRAVLGYASKVLLSGGKIADRAYLLVCAFESHFYDSGRAGLLRACWEVANHK